VADPDRAISRAYGALLEEAGVAARATFVVDPAGVVQYAAFHNLRVGRSISELLRVLEALRTGERAPAEWRPGQPTLGP
jgi:peroxiredoxin (alkyl hydroperoxide reductase subunit C)